MRYLFCMFMLVANWSLIAQTDTVAQKTIVTPKVRSEIQIIEDTLAMLSLAIMNDSIENQRFLACRQFIPTLVSALKTENSFAYRFPKLKHVSIQYPQDSSFRIFTWQLYVDVGKYHYYGAIQMNTPELKLIPLSDRSNSIEDPENDILAADNWYGTIYYNIKDFDTPQGRKYLLFGFDRTAFFSKRKMIEVLSFTPQGKLRFGDPVFHKTVEERPLTKNRIILEYSADANVRCNYDEVHEMVIFDHLMALSESYPGQGRAMVPDGTFEGYQLKNGAWYHVDKIFTTVVDEAPRPEPVLDQRKGKNLFGKQ